jgi:glyoxylase-like metal-dependent hydrolase (beta-lactamase superfamily II)
MGYKRLGVALCAAVTLASTAPAGAAAPVTWYQPAAGFVKETYNAAGQPNGFEAPNPWGRYSAYLMQTNDAGQRTWRIENFLPQGAAAQGSTMYLLEGNERALLVDTAQNTVDVPIVPGQADLVTVVERLLGTDNDGSPRTAVPWVVAITHSHGDHTGKNAAVAPRTIYFPALDWPAAAPSNYRPIKEGGGATQVGQAVGAIALGGRTIEAIDIPEHTPGSTAYLDRANELVATGDGIGSAFVWAHFGAFAQYRTSVHHLQEVLEPYPGIAVMPAHFYQVKIYARALPPWNGRPLDSKYVDDQVAIADGVMEGTLVGEPYRGVGRNAAWAGVDSARAVYTFNNLYPGGPFGGGASPGVYRAIKIPDTYRTSTALATIDNIKTGFYLIRDHANTTMYLVVGSSKALLVGTGSGSPGIASYVKQFTGNLPLEVVVTSRDLDQTGGLAQFAGHKVYVPAGSMLAGTPVGLGDTIDLGTDADGRPARFEVHPLSGHDKTGITLLGVSDRILLSGDALGEQFNGGGLVLNDTLARFDAALRSWRTRTDGRYDIVYTAHNYQWTTSPAFVDQTQEAVTRGLTLGEAAVIPSTRYPGYRMIRSTGGADIVASIVLAYGEATAPGDVSGTVPATLSLALDGPATFGAFTPGVAREYTATTRATVISTAGEAALSVSDPGHLTNGAFALAQPLRVELAPSAWSAPVSNAISTITFKQGIGASDPLRTGTYSKTLTITLSTTTP